MTAIADCYQVVGGRVSLEHGWEALPSDMSFYELWSIWKWACSSSTRAAITLIRVHECRVFRVQEAKTSTLYVGLSVSTGSNACKRACHKVMV